MDESSTLILLYGPPAVGKLTVAKALARRLPSFRILHNHVTIDAARHVLDFGTPPFWRLVGQLRTNLLEAAAEESVDVIFTYVYAPEDEDRVAELVTPFERNAGRVLYVQLLAPAEQLLQRVDDASRLGSSKLTNPRELEELLSRRDLYQPVKAAPSLTLDTGRVTAEEAAELIVDALGETR